MTEIVLALVGIIILFAVFIALRSVFSLKVCALCGAVFLVWITLLTFLYLGYETDPVLIGLLAGGSIVGFMYVLEQKFPERYQVFRLPLFLTLVSAAYFVLEQNFVFEVIVILFLLWVFMGTMYIGRNNDIFKMMGRKIIECCKNW